MGRPVVLSSLVLAAGILAVTLSVACAPGEDALSLAEGDPAPEFRLPAIDGGTVSLSDFIGNKNVLLYFSMGYG
ncbi:MAG: redoxin domain-containing protein [Chloroflexi bacterium]|nr:redoxin domain-containing protein [Chloroflexota bacterium]